MGSTDIFVYRIIVSGAIVLTFVICLMFFHFAHKVYKWLGYTGMLVFTRSMGLFLAALAVDFLKRGLYTFRQCE